MAELTPADPFPDEIFYRIFEIEDHVERTQFVEALRNRARILKRSREFSSVLQSFFKDYQQKMMERGNVTQFTEQPIELQCGPWKATDLGVTMQKFDSRGMPVQLTACMHPILPIEILKNVDTGEERVRLAYFKYGTWNRVTVNREVCADNTMIVKVLSKIGVEVTSENAKYLVRYISDCIGMNPAKLAPTRSINRLGWCGNEFMPYADDIVYDGDKEYDPIFQNIRESGSFEVWKEHCGILRQNKVVRLAFAASFGSALIEILRILPFVFHIWSGESGTCKTVAIMAAMSIWGNPKMGGLVKTMNTTKVGIMRTSAFLYSIPYASDELQTMKDKWTTNFDQLIYQITEGIDRGRGRASQGPVRGEARPARPPLHLRLLVVLRRGPAQGREGARGAHDAAVPRLSEAVHETGRRDRLPRGRRDARRPQAPRACGRGRLPRRLARVARRRPRVRSAWRRSAA